MQAQAPLAAALTLRPYQREAIEAARRRFRIGDRSTLVVLPTGAGKTVVFAEVARTAVERGSRVLVLAHRRELLSQAIDKIVEVAPDLRVALEQGTTRAELEANIIVASVQTLSRGSRLARFPRDAFQLVVVDEAHHAAADSYTRILGHFNGARILGFTATPDRADERPILGTVFDSVAYERSMLDLMRDGYLAPIIARVVHIDAFDLYGARIAGGDLDERDIAEALGRDGVLAAIAELLAAHAGKRSTLVFVAGVDRAHELAALLDAHGRALAIDGTMRPHDREERLAAFSEGRARFLVNVGVATEGTDLPRCSCVAIVRPTMSRGLFTQMVGRGVRPFPGKVDCLLLNFVPSNARHRLVAPAETLLGRDSEASTHAYELAQRHPGKPLHEIAQLALQAAPERARNARLGAYSATLRGYDPFGLIEGFIDLGIALRLDADGTEVPGAREAILKMGVPVEVVRTCSPGLAAAIYRALITRRRSGLCSFKVARQLARKGLNPDVSPELGKLAMDALQAAGWRTVPAWLRNDPRFAPTKESSDAA